MVLNKDLVENLLKKGLNKEIVEAKLNEYREKGKKYFGDNSEKVEHYIKQAATAHFKNVLNQPDKKYVTGLVIGISERTDQNAFASRLTDLAISKIEKALEKQANDPEVKVPYIPLCNDKGEKLKGEFYTPKKGHFTYWKTQGKPIPNTENWNQEVLVIVELNKSLQLKTVVLTGDFVVGKTNNATVGNKIDFPVYADQDMDKDKFYVNTYTLNKEQLTGEEIKPMLDKHMSSKFVTIEEIKAGKTGIGFIKGDVSEMDKTQNGSWRVSLYVGEDDILTFYVDKPMFSEDAIEGIYALDFYTSQKNGETVVGANFYGAFVDQIFQRTAEVEDDTLQDNVESFEESVEEMSTEEVVNNDDIDEEELLL